MTTVTITIDDPNGLDSNLLFPSAAPYNAGSAFFDPNAGTAGLSFRRVVNGVAVNPLYLLGFTGNDFATAVPPDVLGDITSMKLNVFNTNGTLGPQLMHVDFALDGTWAALGGVRISSAASLTADVLMGRIIQLTAANLVIIGNLGNDTLNGSFLDDVLRGSDGGDRLIGGLGSDTASYEFSSAAVVINLATGAASGGHATGDTFSSIENVIGTNFNDNITGSSLANFIDGALGFDTIDGGAGDDFIFGRDGGGVLRGGAGNDRVDGGTQNDTMYGGTGNDELRTGDGTNTAYGEDGNDSLLGASGIDRLYGGSGTDTINGSSGADILDGGLGADTMNHFTGAAIFYVDNAGDIAFDFVTRDGDRAYTSVSYILPSLSGIEFLFTSNAAGTGNLNLTGNDNAQSIYGNNGVNIIDGKGGIDTMTGYGNTDHYYVDNAAGRVFEAAGGGAADRVYTSVS